jgi:hypothetical protein
VCVEAALQVPVDVQRAEDRLVATWGVLFRPQEVPDDFLALFESDCQQDSTGDYNLDKATPIDGKCHGPGRGWRARNHPPDGRRWRRDLEDLFDDLFGGGAGEGGVYRHGCSIAALIVAMPNGVPSSAKMK